MSYILAYCIVAIYAAYLVSGMFWSHSRYWYPSIQSESQREEIGWAVMIGIIYGALWPACLPAAYLMTGFAEHGVWKDPLRPHDPPSPDDPLVK